MLIIRQPHNEPRHVIFPLRIEAGHFCCLTADEGAVCLFAAGDNALDDLNSLVSIQFSHGDVIQHKERGGSLDHDIVDTHGDQVNAHRIVFV